MNNAIILQRIFNKEMCEINFESLVVFERDPTYHYLALFVHQLMEAVNGGGG